MPMIKQAMGRARLHLSLIPPRWVHILRWPQLTYAACTFQVLQVLCRTRCCMCTCVSPAAHPATVQLWRICIRIWTLPPTCIPLMETAIHTERTARLRVDGACGSCDKLVHWPHVLRMRSCAVAEQTADGTHVSDMQVRAVRCSARTKDNSPRKFHARYYRPGYLLRARSTARWRYNS